jgi:hypothetical protein
MNQGVRPTMQRGRRNQSEFNLLGDADSLF